VSARGLGEAKRMDTALLKTLLAGAGSTSQFVGGLIIALLYIVVGLLGAIGSILILESSKGDGSRCSGLRS
jgi:hypothetical protein